MLAIGWRIELSGGCTATLSAGRRAHDVVARWWPPEAVVQPGAGRPGPRLDSGTGRREGTARHLDGFSPGPLGVAPGAPSGH